MKVKLRRARKKDVGEILRLIRELLTFEKLPVPDEKARKRLVKHGFGKEPKFKVILAEVKEGAEKIIAGYAFYFYTYSTLLAKPTLYLEDIYVSEKYRKTGIGKLFFNELIKAAKRNKCGRMEWVVLDWNTNAISFYNKLGAKHLHDWNYYRLEIN